ncbi:hypothetical protein OsJ_34528 [Oryza sativa Japonica Group]|uniref:MATH domain-containing protein n=1 Tax=Oryza sativa subsp. japonica TaxID=39947 RepID=B9G8F0_ORYSJ|nr:hypothetical protein OsJ_34528 [Oryza sativa Japonica Group]
MAASSSAAASTSCAVAAEANGSTSTIVATTKPTGHHILKIDGYSRTKAMVAAGDSIDSSRFHAGDHAWRIRYYPNGTDRSNQNPDAISVMLELQDAAAGRNNGAAAAAAVKAKAELLGSSMKEHAARTIRVDDMKVPVFAALLYFVYTDELPEMEDDERTVIMAPHLLVPADRYDMDRLAEEGVRGQDGEAPRRRHGGDVAGVGRAPWLPAAQGGHLEVPRRVAAGEVEDGHGERGVPTCDHGFPLHSHGDCSCHARRKFGLASELTVEMRR